MDAFENVIASLLTQRGYWTRTGLKVELTKEEKRQIGRHSSPRWELDVVGYSGRRNELLVMECKSFLDSSGVRCDAFVGTNPEAQKRYKLFCQSNLREIVLNRLRTQLFETQPIPADVQVRIGLAAGKIYGSDEPQLKQHFEEHGWLFWSPSFIRQQLSAYRDAAYENDTAMVVTKLLLRNT